MGQMYDAAVWTDAQIIDPLDPVTWPHMNPIEVLTATDNAVRSGKIRPLLVASALLSARLMTLADDHAEIVQSVSPEHGALRRAEIADYARQVTTYFAENISCFAIASEFEPEQAKIACNQLLHGVTVACKHAPDLLHETAVANAVALGYERYTEMTPAARRDQAQLATVLIDVLAHDRFGDVPAHMECLAHQMGQWSRQCEAAGDNPDGMSPPAAARAGAVARLLLTRAGHSADAAEGILVRGEYGKLNAA